MKSAAANGGPAGRTKTPAHGSTNESEIAGPAMLRARRPPAPIESSTAQPATGPQQERQWAAKPPAEGQRPWSPKPPREGQRPWSGKPPPEGQRPESPKPPRERRPWSAKPPRDGQRAWSPKPPGKGQRIWSDKRPRRPQAQRPWTSESAARPSDTSLGKSETRKPSPDRGPQSRQQSERPFKRDQPPGSRETPVPPKRDGAGPPKKRSHESPEEHTATKPEPRERG